MVLQRLKLIEVDDEKGSKITEFKSYGDIKKYAKGKTGAIAVKAVAEEVVTEESIQEQKSTKKSSAPLRGPDGKFISKKKLLTNELADQVESKKGKSSFWDKLK